MWRLEKADILSQKMKTAREKSTGKSKDRNGKDSTIDEDKDENLKYKKQKEDEYYKKSPGKCRLPNHDHN